MGSLLPADADLLAALERAADSATPAALAKLLGDLERLKAVLWQRLLQAATAQTAPLSSDPLDDLRHLTPLQVGELLNLKPAYVHELCRSRKLPATKSGKYWMIPAVELRRWLAYQNGDIDADVSERLESRSPRGDARLDPHVGAVRRPRGARTSA